MWGVGICSEIDKYFGHFLKKLLRVKQGTNTSMIFEGTGRFALSVFVKLGIVKYLLKVINSGDNQLIRIVYEGMRRDTSWAKCDNWTMKVKTILNEYGFGSAWLNQSVADQNKFIVLFERRIKDDFIQHYFAEQKPKVQYIDRKCTLCNDNDIQDEYHIVLKCAYYNEVRRKYIKP